MPLRRKLLLAMLIPAILLGLVGAIGVYSLRHLEQAAGRILADNYRSIQETRNMERALRDLEISPASTTRAERERLAATFDQSLLRCEANITEAGETLVLSRIRSGWNRVRPGVVQDSLHPETRDAADAPDAESATLVAVLRIVHMLATHAMCVVASPHPARDWMAALRPFGVDHFWTVSSKALRRADGLGGIADVQGSICPDLHTVTKEGITLSVCGCHRDRIVLGRKHLDRWCLRSDPSCPHHR